MPAIGSRVRKALFVIVVCAAGAQAQAPALSRAMDHEAAGRSHEAIASYRAALREGYVLPAVLGLERSFAQLGWTDSLVPLVDSLVRVMLREVAVRTVQLRVLRALGRDEAAQAAYRDWIRTAPRDPAPYREWARVLLAEGKTAEADAVLNEAALVLGATRALALESAQLRVALGQWGDAAQAWREAIGVQAYLESAAIFSLRATPADQRRAVRTVFLAAPAVPAPRRVLATLELGWGNGREGWAALRELPAGEETASVWSAFAEEAERAGQWLAARDALLALQRWRPDEQRAIRAATLALEGGDAASALSLAEYAAQHLDDTTAARVAAPVILRAYAALGRGSDAARTLERARASLPVPVADALRRDVAWAWVRAGDVRSARAALGATALSPDDELAGWLALYEGDLAAARTGLRRADPTAGDAVTALAVLVRTEAPRGEEIGAAFLALARRDTAAAARAFAVAADASAAAAPVLLLTASRLHQRQGRDREATALWARLLDRHGDAPEAAEAELEWARLLRRQGDRAAAIEHLEHLILTWPQSALVPQARRELALARGTIPPEQDDV